MQKAQRSQLTLKILIYAIFDVAGIALFASGALWIAQGTALFFSGFPTGTMEAISAIVGGLLIMLWAASQILRELLKRPANQTQKGN